MAYIESSLPPMHVLLRRRYLFDENDDPAYEKAVVISVKCLPGNALLFQVLTESGVLRDKLPISALCLSECEEIPFHICQLWNCFSKVCSVVELNYLVGLKVSVWLRTGLTAQGRYLFTIQSAGDTNEGCDMTLSETPHEHKSHHIVALDSGQLVAYPNNRLLFHDPSFTTKEFDPTVGYKVCTKEYNCEAYDKWVTEDSDEWRYDIKNADSYPDGKQGFDKEIFRAVFEKQGDTGTIVRSAWNKAVNDVQDGDAVVDVKCAPSEKADSNPLQDAVIEHIEDIGKQCKKDMEQEKWVAVGSNNWHFEMRERVYNSIVEKMKRANNVEEPSDAADEELRNP